MSSNMSMLCNDFFGFAVLYGGNAWYVDRQKAGEFALRTPLVSMWFRHPQFEIEFRSLLMKQVTPCWTAAQRLQWQRRENMLHYLASHTHQMRVIVLSRRQAEQIGSQWSAAVPTGCPLRV